MDAGELRFMTLDDLTDLSVGDGPMDFDVDYPKQKKERQMEMTPYNPFASHPMQTWDAITMDRMLTIKRPVTESGEIWITESGFAETLSLIPLNLHEQRLFWKKFRRIQMLASGELNKKVVDTRQDRLMAELVSQKSRKDVIEGGNPNEREMWIINKQVIEQTLRAPGPTQPKGFFASILGGK
jgi:hypothetical protein